MRLEGTIVNGRVELDAPASLPDGSRVHVELLQEVSAEQPSAPATPLSPLAQRLLALAGRATGLPADMARNHDHYIHGTKKR